MWKAVKEMVGQKKFLAAVLSAAAWVAGRYGADVSPQELLPVVAPMWAYIFGQALADWGTGHRTPTTLWQAIRAMAGQKKFLAAVLAAAAWIAGRWGIQLSTAELAPVVGPIWAYIFGQGMADFGKTAKLQEEGTAAGEVAVPMTAADTAPVRPLPR